MPAEKGVGRHENKALKNRRNIYLACDELDFTWGVDEIYQFEDMWKQGKNINCIAEELKRDPDELAILAIDRARQGRIEQRQGGLLGYAE
ncbi:helix-turn-helix domain-containing protein [Paenibacillus sp. Marseille-Q4541]|uniref:helix-turn-helix domain-containing protein n=1 Tax=Paenibacillus sp. Marseille-Q4541 TaxID=2831522 RepID=UPI001BA75E7F|nr:helix-turn-helix domain-containing protein [Paenibacillus sp. Marseille-Q4541]